MSRRALVRKLELPRLEAAIRAAEARTSAELRLSVAGLYLGNPERLAARAFTRLTMSLTRDRNAVLLLVLPWRRRVVVHADDEARKRIDASFWPRLVKVVTDDFRAERYTDGLVAAIDLLAAELAPLFPPRPDDTNELPDAVDVGRPAR